MELTSLPGKPISATFSKGPEGGIDDDSSELDRTVAAPAIKPTAPEPPQPILKKKTPVPDPSALPPSIAPSLLWLLDLLTFVGTAVATEDVFRPRDTTTAVATTASITKVAFKQVNVSTQRLSPVAQGVGVDGGGIDGATDQNKVIGGNNDRGGRGNSNSIGGKGGAEELKDSDSGAGQGRASPWSIEQADLEEGLHQSLDEQIASFGKLKARGLLTEDEYAEAVALIELQRLDLPGDEDLDVDDHQGGEENSRVHNGSSAHGNGSNGKSNSSSGIGSKSNRKSVAVDWSMAADKAAKEVNFGALLADDAHSFDPSLQVVAAKYLLGVFVLDSLAMAVGKVALLEVVLLADEFGYSVVATTLVVTAIEAAVEFVASAAVPFLYRLKFGTWALSARGLVQFAVSAYLTSATFAVVIYPLMGVLTQGLGNSGGGDDDEKIEGGGSVTRSPVMLLVFATCQIIQYPFLNQLGDQAVEMAQPHWLETFENTVLVTPGWKCVDKIKLHKASKVCCAILCGDSAKHSVLMCFVYSLCAPLVCLRSLCRCLCAGSSGSGADARARAAAVKKAEMSVVRRRGDDDDDEDDDEDNDYDDREYDNYDDDDSNFREVHSREEEKEDFGSSGKYIKDDANDYDREDVSTSRNGRIKSHKGWRSKWRFNLYASANNNSLAYFLALNRFVLTALFGAIYLMASRAGDSARWVALCTFSLISFSAARAMAKGFSTIERGIKHGVVEQNHAPTPWIFQMSGGEIALTLFATIAFTAPSDAASAIVVLVVTMTSSTVNLALVFFGGIVVVLHLRRKIRSVHLATKREDWVVVQRNSGAGQKQSACNSCCSEWFSMQKWSHFFKGCCRETVAFLGCCCFPSTNKNKPSITASSSYFARYWELSPAQVAAKEATRARRVQFWTKIKSSLSSCFKCTTFGSWLCEYMCIVLILSLAAILLVASAGSEGLGFNASADDEGGGSNDNGGVGGDGGANDNNEGIDDEEEGSGGPTNLLLLAGLLLIPYFALNANLKARFESVLFHYKEGQVSGIVFHRNLFTVVLKAPILYANWYALQASSLADNSNLLGSTDSSSGSSSSSSIDDDEAAEAAEDRYDAHVGGLVLIVSVAVLVVALIYFATVDRWHLCGKKRSATILVNRTTARVATAITQAAAARVLAETTHGHNNDGDNGTWNGGEPVSTLDGSKTSEIPARVQVRGGGGYLPPLPPSNDKGKKNSSGSKKKQTHGDQSNHSNSEKGATAAEKSLSRADSRAALLKAKKQKKQAKAGKGKELNELSALEADDGMAPPLTSMLVVGAGGLQKQTYETKARADALRAAVRKNPEAADDILGAAAQMPFNSKFIHDRCHNATASGGGFTSPAQAAAFRMVAASSAPSAASLASSQSNISRENDNGSAGGEAKASSNAAAAAAAAVGEEKDIATSELSVMKSATDGTGGDQNNTDL